MEQERRRYRPKHYHLSDGRRWIGDESSGFPEGEEDNGFSLRYPLEKQEGTVDKPEGEQNA